LRDIYVKREFAVWQGHEKLTVKKKERPVGAPAARGHGVMEVLKQSKRRASGAGSTKLALAGLPLSPRAVPNKMHSAFDERREL
jgi:hypothetical protein